MFNSPILDVAIGLIFIFLLYSLLATSIKEAIATLLALRAKMLKKGIVEGMLSKTPLYGRWQSIWLFIKNNVVDFLDIIGIKKKKEGNKIGNLFYKHPLIKNYGSNRVYPLPSYLPTKNFSTVLIDVLKEDFINKIPAIANGKATKNPTTTVGDITNNLLLSNDATKIKELLDYYGSFYSIGAGAPNNSALDSDTWKILQMHLQNSIYDINVFTKKLEDWFDDSMDRVSGWYKRQVQFILFILGFIMAAVFNVDTIQIAKKLTTDKDARDKMVQLAIKASDQYKDDPRVKKTITEKGDVVLDNKDSTYNNSIFKEYQNKITSVQNELKSGADTVNDLLSLGWGDYGEQRDSAKVLNAYRTKDSIYYLKNNKHKIDTCASLACNKKILDSIYRDDYIKLKVGYVISETFRGKKALGFLILAFAVCLGAPFWFDLLNKFIKLRGSGQKEDGNATDTDKGKAKPSKDIPTTTINVNNQKTGDEAVG